MPKVRAIRKCFIDNTIRDEGDVFEYKGPENRHLEYLDAVNVAVIEPEPVVAQAPRPRGRPRKVTGTDNGMA